MLETIIKKIFWDIDKKKLKKYQKIVDEINKKVSDFEWFSQNQIKEKTSEFKALFDWLDYNQEEDLKKIHKIIENIKIEAFALLKYTCKFISGKEFTIDGWEKTIIWNMVPYDVQLIWALALNDGQIAEMKTWEWKTLVATMPSYLNALTGNSVHIVTVNDYLASRDASEMGILYNALWLSVWVITHNQELNAKIDAYSKDIVYATNNELGFDYLRDNMVTSIDKKVQKGHFFALIDEVDSILVDEARTPLIISQPDNEPTSKYLQFAQMAKQLNKWTDYKVDEKQRSATLTEEWIEKVEKMLKVDNIYVSDRYNDLHHIENAIKAEGLFIKDKDYLLVDWEVMIIDEHTWRVLSGRRYSEWLHQAIEAKEWVEIKRESKTLASITFQNFFRMYSKLSWMTGTAKTEEEEFYKVYWLDTLVIPTNRPIARDDRADLLFKNEQGKYDYLVKYIKDLTKTGQPILVWTISVDKSEYLSARLKEAWIKHNVLNAKYHEQEAEIVSQAGQKWAVTIATNMAWRWTDIKLWEGVTDLWGLIIVWTEKHETRRIDNQLRWRSWRQWDPWMTQFLLSPQDEIMRIFGWDKLFGVFNSPMFAKYPDDEPLAENKMLSKRIESIQKQVEWHNFDIRKHILEYDDVINKHREIIYHKRDKILNSENIDIDVRSMVDGQIKKFVESLFIKDIKKSTLIKKVNHFLWNDFITDFDWFSEDLTEEDSREISNIVSKMILEQLDKIKSNFENDEEFYQLEREIVLSSIDSLWMLHIDSMSRLRQSVAFEGYAQKNPLIVYKEKAFQKFDQLIDEISYRTTKAIFTVKENLEIKQLEILESQLIESNDDGWITQTNKSNPLFAKPTWNKTQKTKQKIRV